uniref:Uncharacterized protein n=1 Tax=Spongospora subterranea TaxID=70186 RepID=A0A0H5RAG9_9EUKA|eukprot:CRZ05439.1 hypothetical protein [Spongospora subterranea]
MEQALSAASIAKVEFGKVSDAVVPACRDLYPALAGTATTALVLFDIVKFEIMRDFQQMVSLFTTGMKFPASFKSFWASFSGVFSTCFSCWFSTNAAKVANTIFIVQTLVAIFVFVKFYRLKNRIQPNLSAGLETKSWNMVKEGDKKQIVILTTILTTLFLPVSRDVMQIITCDLRFVNGFSECYTGLHAFEIFLSVLCIIFFIIPTPIVFYHIIERNKPQPSLYDKEGLLREGGYTDANYRDDLKSNLSPFKGLYEPYERRWAYHKVVVMVMKLLIVLPMAIMVASNRVGSNLGSSGVSGLLLSQALATIAVLSVYAIWCWSTRPFLNSTDDVLDGVSRLTILIISLIGLLSSQTDAGSKIFGAFANILAGISSLAAAVMIISGIPKFRSAFKNFREQASFTQNGEEVLVFSKKLSLEKARKLRIWHEFWDVLFAQDAEYRLPSKKDVKGKYEPIQLDYKYGSSPPYLIPFAGTVAERHAENKTICAFESVQSYRSAILAAVNMRQDLSSGLFRDVALLVHSVCGLDVFWDGAVESNEKHSKATCECERETKPGSSQTHFGKAFCVPFPLCVVIRFDDTKEETIFSLSPIVTGVKRNEFESRAQLAQFVAQNMSPEVRRRRQVAPIAIAGH